MNEHFLVTGATGFVGSCLVRRLIRLRQKVSIITRHKELNWRLHDVASQLHIHAVDLLDPDLDTIVRKIHPTVVFHLASYGASPLETNVDQMIDINIKGLLHLLKALQKTDMKIFVNTGSSSEYGMKETLMCEDDSIAPINDYGVCKSTMTLFCQKIATIEHMPILTFRLFSPYGYFESKERFVPTVILNMLNNTNFELSSPAFVRDFIFVEDVVDAYLRSIDCSIPKEGAIINIGCGIQHSLEEVVKVVQKYTGSASKISWNPQNKQSRQIEPHRWQADITRAQSILGWRPKYTLEAGIQKTIQWIKEHENYYNRTS